MSDHVTEWLNAYFDPGGIGDATKFIWIAA